MDSERIINVSDSQGDNKANCVTVTSEKTENPTSGNAIPETEHKGEPETHAIKSEIAAEAQRQEGGTVSAVLGESGQDTAREGQDSQEKSRQEEENERTNREFSETIEKLDSVLLEAGGKEGQIEADGTDVNRTEEVRVAIEQTTESGRETTAQVPAEETIAQVPAEETIAQVSGRETTAQVPAEETIAQVSGRETTVQVPAEETTVQLSGGESTAQVPADKITVQLLEGESTVQVPAEETIVQVSGGETTVEVPAEQTTKQVSAGESTAQVFAVEGTTQVPAVRETPVKEADGKTTDLVGETTVQVSEEPSPPAARQTTNNSASQETCLQVTREEDVSPQAVEGTGTCESVNTQVTDESEAWIDTLVKTIVQEVTEEGTTAGELLTDFQAHVFTESADSSSEPTEEGGHSCAGTTTIPEHEQVTLEQTGAAVTDVQAQVSYDITVQEVCEEEEEVTGTPGQPGETGRQQVGLSSTEGVTVSLTEQETDRQVEASGEAAHRDVTPDLVIVPGREGTSDPGHPAACREKEWLPLICTGSEVRADTAEHRGTEQGTVPEKELCPGAPDMKDREIVEDEVNMTPETPIEREIRLTMEREMTLRQERGISMPVGEPELVEVRRRKVVVEPAALPGKERQLAGAQMQREIQLETQRELDLVEQGKVMGTYDRGPQQELLEKKMIFESMNTESSDPPFKRRQYEIQRSESNEALVELPAISNHVAPATPAVEVKKGPSYAEANGSNIIIIEHASILRKSAPGNVSSADPAEPRRSTPAEPRRSTPAEPRRSTPAEPRRSTPADLRFTRSSSGNSPFPNSESPVASPGSPFQLLPSSSSRTILEREIEEVQERDRELRRQRTSIYGKDNGTEDNSHITPDNRSDIQSGVYQPERPNWRKLEVNWPPNRSMTVNGQQDQAWDSPRTRRQRSALIKSWESGNPNPGDDN